MCQSNVQQLLKNSRGFSRKLNISWGVAKTCGFIPILITTGYEWGTLHVKTCVNPCSLIGVKCVCQLVHQRTLFVLLAYFEQRMRITMSYHVARSYCLRALGGISS